MLAVTDFQNRCLSQPRQANLFLGGGKSGGKSFALVLLAIQHCETFGNKANALVIRRTFQSLEELRYMAVQILTDMYGNGVQMWNGGRMTFTLPNGGRIEFGYLNCVDDVLRYRGRSYTMQAFDELGDMEPSLFMKLRAEIRAPEGVTPRIIATSNPGLRAHDFLLKNFARHAPWKPFREDKTGLLWIHCPSTIHDNNMIDVAAGIQQIEAHDHAEALISGDWTLLSEGSFYLSAYSEKRSVIDDWPFLPEYGWKPEMYIDHGGGSSPTACVFTATALEGTQAPDGSFFPKGSIVIFDEFDDSEGQTTGNWNATFGLSIAKNCEMIDKIAENWNMRSVGRIDPQVTQDHGDDRRLLDVYQENGLHVEPWKRHTRANASSIVRELFHHAQPPERRKKAGLYFTRRAEGCIATIPTLPRSKNDPNLPETKGVPDHHFDAVKACAFERYQPVTRTGLYR